MDPGREMVQCPYDPHHVMMRKRLQIHIIRCARAHPDSDLKACPFNKMHLVPPHEYETHALRCPDRKIIMDFEVCVVKEEDRPKQQIVAEDWGECNHATYDPSFKLATQKIIRKPRQFTRSERRAFYKQERERHGELPRTPSPPRCQDSEWEEKFDEGGGGVKKERDGGMPRTPTPPRFYDDSDNVTKPDLPHGVRIKREEGSIKEEPADIDDFLRDASRYAYAGEADIKPEISEGRIMQARSTSSAEGRSDNSAAEDRDPRKKSQRYIEVLSRPKRSASPVYNPSQKNAKMDGSQTSSWRREGDAQKRYDGENRPKNYNGKPAKKWSNNNWKAVNPTHKDSKSYKYDEKYESSYNRKRN